MKYFEDGDLTVGIQVANKNPPLQALEGDWHIIWGHIDSNERTTDYDEPNALNMMSLSVHHIEPTDKRKKPTENDDNIQIDFNFLKWGLTYQGRYREDGPVTNLRLVQNTTPLAVDADDNAVLLPALVRDDQDMPFISFATSAIDRRQPMRDTYQNMEFVAKKTDSSGLHPLELTRNERLRLGYKMNDDGIFEAFASNDDVEAILNRPRKPGEHNWTVGEKVTKLMKELTQLTAARNRVRTQIGMLKQRMLDELQEVGISPPTSPATNAKNNNRAVTASGGASRASAVKRTSSGAAKPGSSGATKSTPRRGGARRSTGGGRGGRKPNNTPRLPRPIAATNGAVAPSDDEPGLSSLTDEDSDPELAELGSVFTAAGEGGAGENGINGMSEEERRFKMRACDLCNTSVTRRNWGVHINTNKHKINAREAEMPGPSGSGGGGRKRTNGADDGDEGPVSPPSKRRAVTSPDGKLKRPSSMALKRDAVNGVREVATPKSA